MSQFTKYPLFDSSYRGEFPIEQYFIILFDAIPSKKDDSLFFDETIKQFFYSDGFLMEGIINSSNRRDENSVQYLMVNKKKNIIVRIFSSGDKKENLHKIEFTYNIKNGLLTEQLNFDKIYEYKKTKKRSNINLIKMDMGHLDIEQYDLTIPEIDMEYNYGQNFKKVHDVILSRLKKNNDKGIILLHGDPGTGKTSYIKYLTGQIDNKDILFVPPSMAEMLSEPSIIPFLMEHKNSILIIEDGERIISDRDTNGSASGVSNILNLTDGILGDCLGIQIIVTFNMKKEKIDQALLRKGRLIAEHKFQKLSITESNLLLKKIGKDVVVNEEMVLADIYNIDDEVFKTQKENKIGFR